MLWSLKIALLWLHTYARKIDDESNDTYFTTMKHFSNLPVTLFSPSFRFPASWAIGYRLSFPSARHGFMNLEEQHETVKLEKSGVFRCFRTLIFHDRHTYSSAWEYLVRFIQEDIWHRLVTRFPTYILCTLPILLNILVFIDCDTRYIPFGSNREEYCLFL